MRGNSINMTSWGAATFSERKVFFLSSQTSDCQGPEVCDGFCGSTTKQLCRFCSDRHKSATRCSISERSLFIFSLCSALSNSSKHLVTSLVTFFMRSLTSCSSVLAVTEFRSLLRKASWSWVTLGISSIALSISSAWPNRYVEQRRWRIRERASMANMVIQRILLATGLLLATRGVTYVSWSNARMPCHLVESCKMLECAYYYDVSQQGLSQYLQWFDWTIILKTRVANIEALLPYCANGGSPIRLVSSLYAFSTISTKDSHFTITILLCERRCEFFDILELLITRSQ